MASREILPRAASLEPAYAGRHKKGFRRRSVRQIQLREFFRGRWTIVFASWLRRSVAKADGNKLGLHPIEKCQPVG